MARSTIETTVTVTLHLSQEEASWLCAVLQNPLLEEPEGEEPRDRNVRGEIFACLSKSLRT